MNWRLALWVLAALPLLAAAFWGLTRVLPPLAGYAAGFVLYWLYLGIAIVTSTTAADRALLTTFRPPGRWWSLLGFLPVVILAWGAMGSLQAVTLPAALFLVIALAALVNGTLEELFWRGALVPRPDREGMAVSLGLFTLWHLAPLFALGVVLPGGPLAMVLGALVLGAIWTMMRLRSGTLGAAIASHVGVNLFAFTQLAVLNWPGAGPA